VRYDNSKELGFLELLETNDDGQGVEFYDIEYMNSQNFDYDYKEKANSAQNLSPDTKYALRIMESDGLISEKWRHDEGVCYLLTAEGHRKLGWHRSNTLASRILRHLKMLLENSTKSVLLPILVTVLTVLALRFLGLSD